MGKKHNLKNRIFGKLRVLGESSKRNQSGAVYWWCECECGKMKPISAVNLVKKNGTHGCRSCSKIGTKSHFNTQIIIICLQCGKKFKAQKHREGAVKFCSRSCNAKYYYDPNVFTMAGKEAWNKRFTPKMKRLNKNFSQAIRNSLKNGTKKAGWETLVDFNTEDLRDHIEKQFQDGMDWDNYGKWHIDHIIPVAAFNFEKPEHIDFKKCWSLSNLQPLWAKDNMEKRDKLERPFQPSLLL